MNPLYHKLVFALAVLDDDKDSLLILCDILEQNGEMALAQWGRAKKRSRCRIGNRKRGKIDTASRN